MILCTYLEINNTLLYFPANVEFQNQTRKPLKLLPYSGDSRKFYQGIPQQV